MNMTQQRAVTLVELLCTLVLVSFMMTVVMLFLVGFARRDHQMADLAIEVDSHPQLIALLESDIYHATNIESEDDHFNIDTYHQINKDTYESHHLPTRVRWDVREINDRSWLVREQHSDGNPPLITPVAVDIQSFTLVKSGTTNNTSLPAPLTRYQLTLITSDDKKQEHTFFLEQ